MIGTIGHESEPKEKARKDRGGGSAPVSPIYRSPVSNRRISLTRRIEESLVNPFVALNPRAIPPSFLSFFFFSFFSLLPSFTPPLPSPVSRHHLNCFLELPFASSERRRVTINYETNRTNARFLDLPSFEVEKRVSMRFGHQRFSPLRPFFSRFDPRFENFPFRSEEFHRGILFDRNSQLSRTSLLLFSRTVNNRSTPPVVE